MSACSEDSSTPDETLDPPDRLDPNDMPEGDSIVEEPMPAWAERAFSNVESIIPLPLAHPKPAHVPVAAVAEPPKSGILILDKPTRLTSHDVVQAVRRASNIRRVGHAGTLDPLATGVLVVCLGSATRVIDTIQALPKVYRAKVLLGVSTASYDADGLVIETVDPSHIERSDVEAALDPFRGEILQVPPMVSALKHEGERLYKLARQGIEVEREPRPVTIHSLALVDWNPPELTLEMTVSSGTYVRSMAHDLGQALGVGAHLTALRREAIGHFHVEDALKIPQVVEAFAEGWWPTIVFPLDSALQDYSAMVVSESDEAALRNGKQIEGPSPREDTTKHVRVYTLTGSFIGLVHWDYITLSWQPNRVFPKPSE